MNEALRTVDCDHLSITIGPVLRLIERSNKEDYLKGLHLQMVLMWPNSKLLAEASGSDSISGRDVEHSRITYRMPAKYQVDRSQARLALHIAMRKETSTSSNSGGSGSGGSGSGVVASSSSSSSSTPTSPKLEASSILVDKFQEIGMGEDGNNKTWKLAGRKNLNARQQRPSAEDMFSTVDASVGGSGGGSGGGGGGGTDAAHVLSKRPMSIRDRMLGSGGDVSATSAAAPPSPSSFSSASKNSSSQSPFKSRPPLSPSRIEGRRPSLTHHHSRRNSSSTTLTRPDSIDLEGMEENDLYSGIHQGRQQERHHTTATPSPDSSNPDRNEGGVHPSDPPHSLTSYQESQHRRGGSSSHTTTQVFVSDDFTSLDYSAIQTLKTTHRRQICSRDKCIFSFVFSATVISFLITLLLFLFSTFDWDPFQDSPSSDPTKSVGELDEKYDKIAGQIFLICSLVVVLSHVILPRSLQVKWCSSHVTNVLTRNRYVVCC